MFYNYKGYYSVVLLGVVDAHHRFLYANVGSEGRAGDSTIWKESTLYRDLEDKSNPLNIPPPEPLPGWPAHRTSPYFMVGDDAFKLSPTMMKPVRCPGRRKRTDNWADRTFNYR